MGDRRVAEACREAKYDLQESQYGFPYHHLPTLTKDGAFSRHRVMQWGFEYLCYLEHAREIVNELAPTSILEIGCGDGRFIGMLGELGARRVGVDLSARAISFAKAFFPDVEFFAHSAADLEETFNLVAAIEVLEHIPDEQVSPFLRTLGNLISPGGFALLSVPTKVNRLNPKHYRHYDISLLETQLRESGAPLTIVRADHVYRPSRMVSLYNRATVTSWYTVEISLLNRYVWWYVWTKLRHALPGNGAHIIAVINKIGP